MAQVAEPTPRELAEGFALAFQGNANDLACLYGGPLYLVGSFLSSLQPGDIDIRCLLPREDLELWFGPDFDYQGVEWPPARFRLAREELKQSRRHTRRWRRGRIDFQFQPALFGDDGLPIQDERPRIRLDRVPPSYFNAGRGEP